MSALSFFLAGVLAASLVWLSIFALGLAAIRRHRRPDYGRVIIEPAEAPVRSFRRRGLSPFLRRS